MYAIILTGGKQYRVEKDDTIDIELLPQAAGEEITFSEVLLVHDGKKAHVGSPSIASFTVRGKVMGKSRGPKEVSMKHTARKNTRCKFGHRQTYSRVMITEIKKHKEKDKEKAA